MTSSVTFSSMTGTVLCATFTLNEDKIKEDDEAFIVAISTDTGGAIVGSPSSVTITINDRDGAGIYAPNILRIIPAI